MNPFLKSVQSLVEKEKQTWLVTGAAGFIGSNLCSLLVEWGQTVIGLDSLITGTIENIEMIKQSPLAKDQFHFYKSDLRDQDSLNLLNHQFDYVIHQAALGSVPRSMDNPKNSHDNNVNGFLNVLEFCRSKNLPLVYASSSSVYGNDTNLPKVENHVGAPLSPYAATKKIKELYADTYSRCFGLSITGLRYFNIFGPRQSTEGPYSAVIARWCESLIQGSSTFINGDGSTTRDFTFVENALIGNILSCLQPVAMGQHRIFNIAAGGQTSLLRLHQLICNAIVKKIPSFQPQNLEFKNFRAGDVKDSLGNIEKAKNEIGYKPFVSVEEGITKTVDWYIEKLT